MAISTYTELQAAVAAWLNRSDLTARIPEFISMAEAQVNRSLRISRMIERVTATIGTDNQFSSVPTNYLEAITYKLSDGSQIWRLDPTTIYVIANYRQANDSAGPPRFYATSGTSSGREFEHYPTPDQSYDGTLIYYAKLPALGASQATNWLLDEAPDAYLYGALLQAAPYLRDNEQVQIWNAGFTAALDGLRAMDRTPGGLLRADVGLTAQRTGAYDITRDF